MGLAGVSPPRPVAWSLGLIAGTVAAGLAVRFAPLGLPPLVVKFGGSALWAAMVYWLVSTLFARLAPARAGLLAAVVAAAVELFKLYRAPAVDAFRHTLPGVLLFGRVFSGWDLVVYGAAITLAYGADRALRRRLMKLGSRNGRDDRQLFA